MSTRLSIAERLQLAKKLEELNGDATARPWTTEEYGENASNLRSEKTNHFEKGYAGVGDYPSTSILLERKCGFYHKNDAVLTATLRNNVIDIISALREVEQIESAKKIIAAVSKMRLGLSSTTAALAELDVAAEKMAQ